MKLILPESTKKAQQEVMDSKTAHTLLEAASQFLHEVLYIYISYIYIYNDYQTIIEVAQLRQHKQRLNDLRTQLGGWNSYYYY